MTHDTDTRIQRQTRKTDINCFRLRVSRTGVTSDPFFLTSSPAHGGHDYDIRWRLGFDFVVVFGVFFVFVFFVRRRRCSRRGCRSPPDAWGVIAVVLLLQSRVSNVLTNSSVSGSVQK